jgi:tetratricopeptide (TPR) repeat protein
MLIIKLQKISYTALELDPTNARALNDKAWLYYNQGNNEEALKYINQALELDPLDSIVWIHKGNIFKAMENTSGSEAAFAKIKELPAQNLNNETL